MPGVLRIHATAYFPVSQWAFGLQSVSASTEPVSSLPGEASKETDPEFGCGEHCRV